MRSSKLLAGLSSAGYRCHLFCFETPPAGRPVAPSYVESVTVAAALAARSGGRLRQGAALLGRTPRHFRLSFQPEVLAQLEGLVERWAIDVVIAYELGAGQHVARLSAPGVVKILDGCEPFMFRAPRPNLRSAARLWKFKRFLRQLLEHFDAYIAVSDAELAWIREEIGPRRGWGSVIANGTDLAAPYAGIVDLNRIIYTGSLTYRANLDAVDYFAHEVWPQVRRRRPSARFVITGQPPDAATIQRLEAIPGVVIAGLLDDYRDFVAGSGALAVPLREGGGTRIKILEALALGCPVVASSKAVEGLELEPGRELLVADDAERLAAAVIRTLTDPGLRTSLIENGRKAASRYSWERSQRRLIDVVRGSMEQRAFLQPA